MNKPHIIINHPGRNEDLQYFNKNCAAATPPSKGGETFASIHFKKKSLNLTAMPFRRAGGLKHWEIE